MDPIENQLLYAGLAQEDFSRLMPQARHENEGKLKTYALAAAGLFLALTVLNFFVRIFPISSVICYAAMAVFSAGIYALARFLPARRPLAATALCYAFVAALYVFSLVVSALHPELPAVAAIAMMLMGPFLFTERPVHLIVMNGVMIVLLCVLSFLLKSRELALIDLWNAFAFGVISIIAELTQEKTRFSLLYNADRIKYLSETDMLTGCKNRNCFQERSAAFSGLCRRELLCVYVDVNGLHNLNDSKGHDAGDIMLQTVARALLDAFGTEHTYRIGGDEFVVMRMDADTEETWQQLRGVMAALSKQGYDISAGVAAADKDSVDIPALVKRAEQGMYREKQAYYEQTGHDRRRR